MSNDFVVVALRRKLQSIIFSMISPSPIPIAFAFNDQYAHPAAAAITSLLQNKNEDTFYEIYIIHAGSLSEETKQVFEDYYPTHFSNFCFKWICIEIERLRDFPLCMMSLEAYFRLLLPELVPEHEKILWADSDFVFLEDVSAYYNVDISNHDAALPRDIVNREEFCSGHAYYPHLENDYIYTTCLLLINSKRWRERDYFSTLCQNAREYYGSIKLCDLDLVNLTCREVVEFPFKSSVLVGFLTGRYADSTPWCPYEREEVAAGIAAPSIIHYAGRENPKPWKKRDPYFEVYEPWLDAIRQSPYRSAYSVGKEYRKRILRGVKSLFRPKKRQKYKKFVTSFSRVNHRSSNSSH